MKFIMFLIAVSGQSTFFFDAESKEFNTIEECEMAADALTGITDYAEIWNNIRVDLVPLDNVNNYTPYYIDDAWFTCEEKV